MLLWAKNAFSIHLVVFLSISIFFFSFRSKTFLLIHQIFLLKHFIILYYIFPAHLFNQSSLFAVRKRDFTWPCRDHSNIPLRQTWLILGLFWLVCLWLLRFLLHCTPTVLNSFECFHSPWGSSLKCNTLLTPASHLYIHLSAESL